MNVRRIVSNLPCDDAPALASFYRRVFGLDLKMDQGFIVTVGSDDTAPVQLNLASEGGSGTPVPALSIEVDDLDAALGNARAADAEITYGPTSEPWGVRRFYLRDPAGTLVNVLCHE